MILTSDGIVGAIEHGEILIDPFDSRMLNPNSVNFRLQEELLVPLGEGAFERIEIPDVGYVLLPGRVYLGATYELIGSDQLVVTLLGRSSIGRLGLYLNVTADLAHVGSASHWTLEMEVVQPLRIYPRMKIGQVAFWRMTGTPTLYEGRYHRDGIPLPSKDRELGLNNRIGRRVAP